ncbi:MAG: hypothetical protein ACKVT0_00080 [Planctomycetaceae bacterium]
MSVSHQTRRRGIPPPPVLKVTRFELLSSQMVAVVIFLAIAVSSLGAYWFANRLPRPRDPVPVEMVEMPGGSEDGAIDETLNVDSPEPETQDPSMAEVEAEETQIQETLENVVDIAQEATNQVEQQFQQDALNTGKVGSVKGTGRRALGAGPGKSGFGREQRWFVRWGDRDSLEIYASQLDFFGIELGILQADGKIVYISKLSDEKPQSRTIDTGKDEKRLFMTWQGGDRKKADMQLIEKARKAGVQVGEGLIFHFYPPQIEAMLADIERKYRNKKPDEIRRTYFAVRGSNNDYEFYVSRQTFVK